MRHPFRRLTSLVATLLIPVMFVNAVATASANVPSSSITKAASRASADAAAYPQAAPLPAHVPTHDDKLASLTSAEKILASVPLGTSLRSLLQLAGTPSMMVRQSGRTYWAFSIDDGHAWFLVGAVAGTVTSAQIIPKAHQQSGLHDKNGVAAGDAAADHKLAPLVNNPNVELDKLVFQTEGDHKRFYGVDRAGKVTRFGLTRQDTTMPVFLRWFETTGWTIDRPIPLKAYGGTSAGEDRYLAAMQERHLQCIGGNAWHAVARSQVTFAGVPIDKVTGRCGIQDTNRAIFFNRSETVPRSYDADIYAQHLLTGAALPPRRGAARRALTDSAQLWFTTPNGTRCVISSAESCDLELAYTDDPDDSLTSLDYDLTTVSPTGSGTIQKLSSRLHSKALSGEPPISCSFSAGGGKCTVEMNGDAAPCAVAHGNFTISGIITTHVVCISGASTPGGQPRPQGDTGAPNDRNSGGGGCSGRPIDAVSGELRYEQTDATLSGPFGLKLSHRYDSPRPIYYPASYYYQPPGTSPNPIVVLPSAPPNAGLGAWWRTNYSYFVSAWTIQPVDGGAPTYFTVHYPDCRTSNFEIPYGASGAYDQFSGATLSIASPGLVLTTWDNQQIAFTSSGTMMWAISSMTDRIGNTQSFGYSGAPNGSPSTITDALGRSLNLSYDGEGRLTRVTSTPSGVNQSFGYTGSNCTGATEVCTSTESDGGIWSYQYTSSAGGDLLTEVLDPTGHIEESNQYQNFDFGSGDAHYRVTHQEVDGGKQARNYAYTLGQTVISDELGLSHQTTYTWDQLLQQVTSVQGPLCDCDGNRLTFSYDTFGRLLAMGEGATPSAVQTTLSFGRDTLFVSPDGLTKYIQLAILGPTQIVEPRQATQNGLVPRQLGITYYPVGDPRQDLMSTYVDASVDTPGNVATTTLTYASNGTLTNAARSGFVHGTPTTRSVALAYDSRGRVQSVTGPRTDVSQQTQFNYFSDSDADLSRRGQLASTTSPVGLVTSYASAAAPNNSFSIFGGPLSAIDPNGVVQTLSYDGMGRLASATLLGVSGDPANLATSLTYDGIGQLLRMTRPLGNAVGRTYSGANERIATTVYDGAGLQRDQLVIGYDIMSRPISSAARSCLVPAAACSAWTTQYADGQQYTNNDQLANTQAGIPGATSFTYGNTGSLTSATSGDAHYSVLQTIARDPAHYATGILLGKGDAGLALTHDLQGNLDRITPQQSSSTVYQYDDFGQVISEASPITGRTTYVRDSAGNVTLRIDANGATTTTSYDAANRPLVATSSRSGLPTETVTRTYDNSTPGAFGLGHLSTMTDPSGSNSYTYERHGLVASRTQVINGTTYPTTYAYDGNGNRTSIVLPSGRHLTYTFDYADRPSSVSASGTTYVSSASYEPFGPIAALQFGNGTTQTWLYTQRYLPAEEKLTSSAATLSDLVYTENGAGYVTSITDALDSGYNRSFTYGGRATNMLAQASTGSKLWHVATYVDGTNQNLTSLSFPGARRGLKYSQPAQQLISVSNGETGSTQTVTHDAAGNETSVGSSAYTYSARNHLASGDGISYVYDGSGQRVSAATSTGTRTSLYDSGMHLQSESGLTDGAVAYDYVWFGNLPVAQEDVGGSTHWTVTDYLGTPFMQTDGSANVYWQADYQPYGLIAALRTATAHQPLRFPGQEAEQLNLMNGPNGVTDRYYNAMRWYRPLIGRYTQPDPLMFQSGSYTLYQYAINNPTNLSDALGLSCSRGRNGRGTSGTAADAESTAEGEAASAEAAEEAAAEAAAEATGGFGGLSASAGGGVVAAGGLVGALIGSVLAPAENALGGEIGSVAQSAASNGVLLDTNAVIAALEQGEAGAVDTAVAGSTPYVSPTVVSEFSAGNGDLNALGEFLGQRGGGQLTAESEQGAADLQGVAESLGRVLRPGDAEVGAAARAHNLEVITRDDQFYKLLRAIGIGAKKF